MVPSTKPAPNTKAKYSVPAFRICMAACSFSVRLKAAPFSPRFDHELHAMEIAEKVFWHSRLSNLSVILIRTVEYLRTRFTCPIA
jgi:hypothetical protein